LHLVLERDGARVRVPYLMSLVHPVTVVGGEPRLRVSVAVDAEAAQSTVLELLAAAAKEAGTNARTELVAIDAQGAEYYVEVDAGPSMDRSRLLIALSDALQRGGVKLGLRRAAEQSDRGRA
jgi:hypothetical protein